MATHSDEGGTARSSVPFVAAGADSGMIRLPEGTLVPYRPIGPRDVGALQRFHGRLSPHSVYLRYLLPMPALSERNAGYFARVDGVDRFALVALDPGRTDEIIAVASFDREGDTDRAEYAAAVEDRWQGRGLGLALARRLIEAALKRNVRTFTGIVLPENARMLNLFRDLGLPERLRYGGGVEYVEIDLSPHGQVPGREEGHRHGPES